MMEFSSNLRWHTYVVMAIDAARHTMVNFATNHCGICSRTNLKTSNTIIVDIVPFVVTLEDKKHTHSVS